MTEFLFIGRERELERLGAFLDEALAGKGQVAFVTGEAGTGKTALVNHFEERMEDVHADLIVASGNCNAHAGISDPYLPFRELLALLTGVTPASTRRNDQRLRQVAARSIQLMIEVGPNLIGTFVPGASLVGSLGKFLVQKVGWMDELERIAGAKRGSSAAADAIEPERIFEQYANVLKALAQDHPLLLVVDDLQWVDDASASLLFHLSRRIETSRILIVGTYRPDEVHTDGPTSLAKTLAEVKRYYGDVWVGLGTADEQEGRAFVNRLIDSEPNCLGPDFRDALFGRTCGHPLFTIELLRMLEDRGDLVKDSDGCWAVSSRLDWNVLPARVEGVIEERLARLEPTQRDLLRAASIECVDFLAEVVAQLQQMQLRMLLKELSQNLERRHRLVRQKGELRLEKQRLAAFEFAHALFQRYLYNEAGASERRLMHGEVARILEELYAGHTEEVCAQLAWHYDQAGEEDKAVDFSLEAGERAIAQGATTEAQRFFNRALELLAPRDYERRRRALLGLTEVLILCVDSSALQVTLGELLQLAEEQSDEALKSEALYHRSGNELYTSHYHAALEAAESSAEAARKARNRSLELRALGRQISCLTVQSELAAAGQLLEHVLPQAQALGDEPTLLHTLLIAALFSRMSGDYGRAGELYLQAIPIAHRLPVRPGYPHEGKLRLEYGETLMQIGLYDEARRELEKALTQCRARGDRQAATYAVLNLGETYIQSHEEEKARDWYNEGMHEVIAIGHAFMQGVLYYFLGRISEQAGDWAEAKDHYRASRQGLESIGRTSYAMDSTAALARCLSALGEGENAYRLAEEVWNYVCERGTAGMECPMRAYAIVAEILDAAGNRKESVAVVEAGYRDLTARARKITSPEWRKVYWENVPENRMLVERWQRLQGRECGEKTKTR